MKFIAKNGGDAGKKEIGKGPGKAKAKEKRKHGKCRTKLKVISLPA